MVRLRGRWYSVEVKLSPLSIGDVVELKIDRLAYGGEGVGRHERFVIFVPFAAPGDHLRVQVTECKKNFARARIEQVLTLSTFRAEPPCKYFGICGGCQLQHINYGAQLEAKAGFVRDALKRIAGVNWDGAIEVRSGMEYGYRSRAQIRVERKNNEVRVGFNEIGSHSICDIDQCPVLVPELNRALALVRSKAQSLEDPAREKELREIDIAAGEQVSGSAATASEPPVPGLESGILMRTVAGVRYRFSPSTFFQGNWDLIQNLVHAALDNYRGTLAIDLYAGAGLFTVQLGRLFERVIGIESDRTAAEFARKNLKANEVKNAEFHSQRAEDWLDHLLSASQGDSGPPDLILLNPPRTGALQAIRKIASIRPSQVCYVSCDPNTLARDLQVLVQSGYELTGLEVFDLFPQTYHVETVAHLALGAVRV